MLIVIFRFFPKSAHLGLRFSFLHWVKCLCWDDLDQQSCYHHYYHETQNHSLPSDWFGLGVGIMNSFLNGFHQDSDVPEETRGYKLWVRSAPLPNSTTAEHELESIRNPILHPLTGKCWRRRGDLAMANMHGFIKDISLILSTYALMKTWSHLREPFWDQTWTRDPLRRIQTVTVSSGFINGAFHLLKVKSEATLNLASVMLFKKAVHPKTILRSSEM